MHNPFQSSVLQMKELGAIGVQIFAASGAYFYRTSTSSSTAGWGVLYILL
jgi:hypothetical protein